MSEALCSICGRELPEGPEPRVLPEGGSPCERSLPICLECSRKIQEGALRVEIDQKRFRAWRRLEDGRWQEFQPWAALKTPAEVSEFLHSLQREPLEIGTIVEELSTWNDEALVALDHIAREREAEMAELRCAVIGILYERFLERGLDRSEARRSAAERVHESPEMAEKLIKVWERFIKKGISLRSYPLLSLTNFVIAAEHPDPIAALEYVEDLKESGLKITTRKQRQLQRAGLPRPEKVGKAERLRSCYKCIHLARAGEHACLKLVEAGREVARGRGRGVEYCRIRRQLLSDLGPPIEVAEACADFEWREGGE